MLFPPTLMTKLWQKCLELASDEQKLWAAGSRDLSWAEKVERGRGDVFGKKSNSNFENLRKLEEDEFPRVHRIMKKIADEFNQPVPTLYIYDNSSIASSGVAFTMKYSVGILKAVCEECSEGAIEDLLAHEFSHFFDKKGEIILYNAVYKLLGREGNNLITNVSLNVALVVFELLYFKNKRDNERTADGLSAYFSGSAAGDYYEESAEVAKRVYEEQKKESEKDVEQPDKGTSQSRGVNLEGIPILRRYARSHPSDKSRLADMEKGTYVDRAVKQIMGDSGERTK